MPYLVTIVVALVVQAPQGRSGTTVSGPSGERWYLGAAKIKGRMVTRARVRATNEALLKAVWERLQPWVASGQRTRQLRRSLGQKVRPLIAWFRTRKKRRQGQWYTVHLAVRVDEAALKQRLRALGVRVLSPGVLILNRCKEGAPVAVLARALREAGLRPLLPPQASASSLPDRGASAGGGASAGIAAALEVTCVAKGRTLADSGPFGAVVRLKVTVSKGGRPGAAAGTAARPWWQTEASGRAVVADSAKAKAAAVARAGERVAQRLVEELPARLPAGVVRNLLLKVRGGLGVAEQFTLARRMAAQLSGIKSVLPRRFEKEASWFVVRTSYGLAGLKQALAALTPPSGWQLAVLYLPQSRGVELVASVAEEETTP